MCKLIKVNVNVLVIVYSQPPWEADCGGEAGEQTPPCSQRVVLPCGQEEA